VVVVAGTTRGWAVAEAGIGKPSCCSIAGGSATGVRRRAACNFQGIDLRSSAVSRGECNPKGKAADLELLSMLLVDSRSFLEISLESLLLLSDVLHSSPGSQTREVVSLEER
jgi:hypothetical protein